jgi:acetyltransferase-like isoleucine patch superfamily enzyme
MTKMKNMARLIKDTLVETIATLLRFMPGPLGYFLRRSFYKRRLKFLGKRVIIEPGVYMMGPKYISIGDNTWIDKNVILIGGKPTKGERVFIEKGNKFYKGEPGELKIGRSCHISVDCIIQAHGGVQIGDYAGLAAGAKIYSMSLHYKGLNGHRNGPIYKYSPMAPEDEQCLIIGPVVMEDNTGLALNSVILGGATVGKNSWVGVNSCVIGDIPPNSIAMGCPAKVIKTRFE